MRILLDYRPALRVRSGVGEWVHQLSRAILDLRQAGHPAAHDVDLTLFTASWSDRPALAVRTDLPGAAVVDRRIPTRLLSAAWNRLAWPPVERLVRGPVDVVHSPSPVLIPAAAAARVITVHDLDFLDHPERTRGEMHSDYPRLVARHAHEADLVVAVSHHTANLVRTRFGLPSDRVIVCRAGLPAWLGPHPELGQPRSGPGYILFLGTLEPRKNISGLLDAYELLLPKGPVPPLVLAGQPTGGDDGWRPRLSRSPLAGCVELRGYVPEAEKASLYRHAALLVLPSFDEGFGLPVLEAMATGVPVVATRAGAIPEVAGDAALLVPPGDVAALTDAMWRVLSDPTLASALRDRGAAQARTFDWSASAAGLLDAFRAVLERRRAGERREGRV